MIRLLLALMLFTALAPTAASAAISAEVDRTRLRMGETVTYRLRQEGSQPAKPDFTPLKAHFDILSQSQSAQTRIINWKREEFREWTLVLAPKRTGIVVIPPIRVGNAASQPITLQVAVAGGGSGQEPAAVFIETLVEPSRAHVQSQLLLTVRVVHRYELEGNLTEPEIAGAVVEKLGEQRTYSEVREGIRYRVTERRYAVFPQRSGTLQIPQLVLTGTLHNQQQSFGFNPFGPTQQGRTIRLRSDARQVEVLPRPADWPPARPWLPARSVTLEARWTPDTLQSRVGEPLVLQLTTEAEGLSATQLPAPEIRWPGGLKVYPDKAVQDNRVSSEGITGTRIDRYTVIPTHGGRFQIPAYRLAWWDTASDRHEQAEVAAVTLEVAGAPASQAPARPTASTGVEADRGSTTVSADAGRGGSFLPWMLALLFALGWVATTVLWLRERRAVHRSALPGTPHAGGRRDPYWYAIARACREDDGPATYTAVLHWLRQLPPATARDMRQALRDPHSHEALATGWRALEAGLYRPGSTAAWDGLQFFQALSAARKALEASSGQGQKSGELARLYPEAA